MKKRLVITVENISKRAVQINPKKIVPKVIVHSVVRINIRGSLLAMKKNILFLSIYALIILISCTENEELNSISKTKENINSTTTRETPVKFHLFYATWDEWGRTSRDCKGFGLCNFTSCTFCCTDAYDNIVDCIENNRIANSGIIKIFDNTKLGFMIIKLNPTDSTHDNAIRNRKTLYIDSDLRNENLILLSGEYIFDNSIGEYGGYKISAKRL